MRMRVLITGAEDDAREFARTLTKSGFDAYSLTTIRVTRLPLSPAARTALKNRAQYDYVFFTSARAAQFFSDAITSDSRGEKQKNGPVYVAVGENTADVLKKNGLQVRIVPERYSATDMIDSLGDFRGASILFPRSKVGSQDTVRKLRKGGAIVRIVPLYTTRSVAADRKTFEDLFKILFDCIVFLSPSSVLGFSKNPNTTILRTSAARSVAVAIGETTARAATKARFKRITVPKTSNKQGIIAALKKLRSYAT